MNNRHRYVLLISLVAGFFLAALQQCGTLTGNPDIAGTETGNPELSTVAIAAFDIFEDSSFWDIEKYIPDEMWQVESYITPHLAKTQPLKSFSLGKRWINKSDTIIDSMLIISDTLFIDDTIPDSDTVTIYDTTIRYDTILSHLSTEDTAYVVDSLGDSALVILSSAKSDTTIAFDTVITSQPIITLDTLFYRDTIIIKDTLYISTGNYDSTGQKDSLIERSESSLTGSAITIDSSKLASTIDIIYLVPDEVTGSTWQHVSSDSSEIATVTVHKKDQTISWRTESATASLSSENIKSDNIYCSLIDNSSGDTNIVVFNAGSDSLIGTVQDNEIVYFKQSKQINTGHFEIEYRKVNSHTSAIDTFNLVKKQQFSTGSLKEQTIRAILRTGVNMHSGISDTLLSLSSTFSYRNGVINSFTLALTPATHNAPGTLSDSVAISGNIELWNDQNSIGTLTEAYLYLAPADESYRYMWGTYEKEGELYKIKIDDAGNERPIDIFIERD